jgi:hypothetical protein
MICDEEGELICCEDCPNVAHMMCLGLKVKLFLKKKSPEEWRCDDCNYRLANKRLTRSAKN